MNLKSQRLRTRFAPEVGFNVEPIQIKAAQATELDLLKNRLLRHLIERATDPQQNTLLRRAANEAAALVWLTPCPLLLFPVLLEEKARTVLLQRRRQARIRRRSLNLLPEAA